MRGYKIKVTLVGSKPPIWRTFIFPEALTLREMPDVFERVMGWRDSEHDPVRLARFEFPDSNSSFTSDGSDDKGQHVRWDEETENRRPGVTVKRMKPRTASKDEPLAGPLLADAAAGSGVFRYFFLPGASEWEHKVQVQKVVEDGPAYPELLAHSGDCPPAEFEGGIFRYQKLSQADKKKTRAGHFPYNAKMIAERLKEYYTVTDGDAEGGPKKEIINIKISEDDMVKAFMDIVREKDAKVPDHFSFRDGMEEFSDHDLEEILLGWDVRPEETEGMNSEQKIDIIDKKIHEPGMLERYMRALSDREWKTLQNVMEWETKLYYMIPGEDYFYRMWREGFMFRTEIDEIQTPDEIREIFRQLDGDPFFAKRRQETSWVRDCAEMAVELYGFVPVAQVTKLCKLKSGVHLKDDQVRAFLMDITPPQRGFVFDEERDELVRRRAVWLQAETLRPLVREDLDFLMPPLKMIGVQHGNYVFPDEPQNLEPVKNHLERWHGKGWEPHISLLLEALSVRLPSQETTESLEEVLRAQFPEMFKGKDEADEKEFVKRCLHLEQHLRCKLLRGWTQDEVERGIPEKAKLARL